MDTQSIGERLKMLRKKANLSVDELSAIIGKDRATVYRYERGDIRKLPFELLEPLAKAFNVTPADIVGIADEDNLILSNEEKQLVLAYRNQPEMQKAVNKLLGIAESPPSQIVQTKKLPPKTEEHEPMLRYARTDDLTSTQPRKLTKEQWEELENGEDVDLN